MADCGACWREESVLVSYFFLLVEKGIRTAVAVGFCAEVLLADVGMAEA